MRTVIAAAAVACALTDPSWAAEIEAASKVDTVTVYPDGASVTRVAIVELPTGASTIVLKGLPATIDPASLRVAGKATGALSIGAVETRAAPGNPRPVIDAALEEKIKALREKRDIAAARMEALERTRAMIRRYSEASPEKLSPDGKAMDAANWPAAWAAVVEQLTKANEDIRVLAAQLRDTDGEIAALERARPQPPRPGAPVVDVTIALEARAASKAELAVTYRVAGASWRPLYDARLDTGGKGKKASLELVRRAAVTQRTGEPWDNVTLIVSTVRVARGAAAPELMTSRVRLRPPPQEYARRERSAPAGASPAPAAPAMEPKTADKPSLVEDAREQQAQVQGGAFQASFGVPGRVTIPADGAAKTFRISSTTVAPQLLIKTVPLLNPTAYLQAMFNNDEEAPLLPGPVNIHRDGTFVGRSALPMVAQGDKVELSFGADDQVKVTRVPVARRQAEPGFLGSSRTDTAEFKTVVKNLHDFPIKITVIDRVPVSEVNTITVEMLDQTTKPTEATVEDRRGVMSWTYEYAAGEQKEIRLAYRVKWPSDRDVMYGDVR
ncbi:MAG: mucoidy inhibitor MuiA family protein [Reyranellaceae bacterium]